MHRGGFLTIFLVIAGITLLFDWYVFAGLKTLTNDWQSQRARWIVIYGYLVISIGVTALFLLGFGSFSTAKGMTPFHEWMLSLFLTFFYYQTVFCAGSAIGRSGPRGSWNS